MRRAIFDEFARVLLVGACISAAAAGAPACTDFRIKAADGTVVIGRTLDFEVPVLSWLKTYPRGERRASKAPDGRPGIEWTSKFGYVGIDVGGRAAQLVGISNNLADGMNERGLTFAWLALPDFTKYQDEAAAREPGKALGHWDLCNWALGNFATVAEVRAAVADVHIWGQPMHPLNLIMPLHAAVHDETGASIVLEFTEGGLKVHDNEVGVLTNAPTYDWHLINLRNYLNLRARSAEPVRAASSVLSPLGPGSGLLGIPGDWTSPSRFVRIAAMKHFASRADDAEGAVILAEHLLGSVTLPRGLELTGPEGSQRSDYTRWSVIKDLSNRVYYFRGHDSHALRAVRLRELDFGPEGKRRSIRVGTGGGIVDVTKDLGG
jgi:choloylglycine hydrolase